MFMQTGCESQLSDCDMYEKQTYVTEKGALWIGGYI